MNYNDRFHDCNWLIGSVEDFEKFQPYLIQLQSQEYVIWRDHYQFYGIENTCPHAGASLAGGSIFQKNSTRSFIKCPYHGICIDGSGDLANFNKVNVSEDIVGGHVSETINVFVIGSHVWLSKYSKNTYVPDIEQSYFSKSKSKFMKSSSFEGVTNVDIVDFMANVIDTNHFANVHYESFFVGYGESKNIKKTNKSISFDMDLHKRRRTKKDRFDILYNISPKILQQQVSYFAPGVVVIESPFDSMFSRFGYGALKGQKVIAIVSCYPIDDNRLRYSAEFWNNFQLPSLFAKILNLFMGKLQKSLFQEDFAILDGIKKEGFQKKVFLPFDEPIECLGEILDSL